MYIPVLPLGGIGGWRLLERTEEAQREALSGESGTAREIEYFKQNIGAVRSADDLLADRRLLQVALTAYGLEDEIGKSYLIKRVLDEGTDAPTDYANLLNDERWSGFSSAFGFGDSASGYEKSPFQVAVELKFRPTSAASTSAVDADDIAHFRANVGSITSIDDLLADSRTLDVALAAFGVERGYYNDDHFRQLIEEGTGAGTEYAYDLGDSGWVDFAAAFSGLETGGTIETFSRFALDVEREVARRDTVLYTPTAADAEFGKISTDDLTYFRANIGAVSNGAELLADATLKEVALVAFGLAGTSLSDAEIEAILDGGVGVGAPAHDQSDSAWVQLAASFDAILTGGAANDVPSFQIDIEVGIADQDLEPIYYLDDDSSDTPTIDEEELAYFSANIAKVETSDDLLADERLLAVALTAFGLENEGKSEGYIKSILDEDPYADDAFVNQLSDTRWAEFAKAFNPPSDGSVNPAIWRYEIEERLIASGAPEEDLFYLRQNFNLIDTNLDFVLDRELMDITLSAFGLEKDAYSATFVVSAMISDLSKPTSFVNQLKDERWTAFTELLGSTGGRGNTGLDSFVDQTIQRYLDHSFELAIGEQDEDLRVALNFRRRIAEIATGGSVDEAGWLQIMGDPPMRLLMDTAFGLPSQFAQLDIEAQQAEYRRRAQQMFGGDSAAVFQDKANVDRAIDQYLLRQSAAASPSSSTPGYGALTLMQQTASFAQQLNVNA